MTADAGALSWPDLLAQLFRREDLSGSQASDALGEILSGDVDPVVVGAFVAALRTKGERVEEIAGFVRAMRAAGEHVSTALPVVDTCGTGGDRAGTVNISTTAAFVIAGAGVPVCKHGGRAASSLSGSADVLEALGVAIGLGPDGVERCLDETGFGFCFAPRFHPAMRHVAPVRAALRVPTVFNFLGPLSNPAGARRQVIGVSHPEMAETLLDVLVATGSERAMVFFGHDGLDELSTTAPSTVLEFRRAEDGSAIRSTFVLDATDLGLERANVSALVGGTPGANAERVRAVLAGEGGPQRDIVLLNAAAALVVADAVGSFAEGLADAATSVDSGAAATVLERVITVSQAAARS